MVIMSNYLVNIYDYTYRHELLSTVVSEAFFFSCEQQSTERDIPGKSDEKRLSAQN